jgi:hypothetical protein
MVDAESFLFSPYIFEALIMSNARLCHPRMQLLAALACMLAASSLHAQVRSLDLREMVGSAGMIFVGVVTDVHGGYDENGDIVTYTTFSVEQSVQGVAGSTVTVKQLGGQAGGLSTYLQHMRYFKRGERVLAMFYPVSHLGFTSPVGLEQGVWTVGPDNRIYGVRPEILRGLGSELTRQGITATGGAIERARFIGLIQDILAPAAPLKKGGASR